ncbi:hypothetical protein H4R33_002444 [Dimargaris cristalligena]|nr:hypothetical protein H4R33_002444 [Dimargaris cristalligena]
MQPLGPNIGTHASQFLLADADREALARKEIKYAQFREDLKQGAGKTGLAALDIKSKSLAALYLGENDALLGQATHVIKWIQLETGMARRVFRGHTGPVTSLAVWQACSSDNVYPPKSSSQATHSGASSTVDLLISGSWDKTIKLWDMATGECVRTLAGHSDFIKCLALVPGGRVYRSPAGGSAKETTPWLFSGSTDATIRQWDLRTGQCVRTFPKVHSRGIDDLVYDGSTNTLFSASSDTTIRQWNIVTGQVVREFRGHHTSVHALCLFPDYVSQINQRDLSYAPPAPSPKTGTRVVPNDADDDDDDDTELWSCSADKDIKQWCPRTGQCITTLTHPNVVKSLTVTDAHVITGCRDENIRIWSKATGKCLKVLVGHFDEITGLAVIDQTIYSTSLDGTLRKWQISSILKVDGLYYPKPSTDAEVVPGTTQPENSTPANSAKPSTSGMTEEEERELAELISDEDG